MRRELALRAIHDASVSGSAVDTKRALAVGRDGVALILAAYGIEDRSSFEALPLEIQDFLVAMVMLYSGCMRFGHFASYEYKRRHFSKATPSGSWRLACVWSKYKISAAIRGNLKYSILFRIDEFFQVRRGGGGTIGLSAATILSWRLDGLEPSASIFGSARTGAGSMSRDRFQAWLRKSFAAALPKMPIALRLLLTPHSFRAGWASDAWRANMRPVRIKRGGRWHSDAYKLYVRDGLFELVDTSMYVTIMHCQALLEALS
jgi:hypothetical protein